ncbi:phosphodiester glycosidase family protein [Roseateles sp.]|uniref:phosphodiester glycosidase family protein n=1 Tax=Roseateles sp. TaxID=1971397 RepID=UPI0037CC776D
MKLKTWSLLILPLALLAGCLEGERRYVDEDADETLSARTLAPPSDVEQRFANVPPPVVNGITQRETAATEISAYHEMALNADLRLASGRLNHTKGSGLHVLSFRAGAGSGIELRPIERSTGQFSMETTTASANRLVDDGVAVVAAVNADPYNTFNGWNVGIVTLAGQHFTGASPQLESAVVVRKDGSIDIVEKLPAFQLRWSRNQGSANLVKEVFYFDKENARNSALRQTGGNISIYPGDNYRGSLDLRGKTAFLLSPEVNDVTVVANADGKPLVQFAPLRAKVSARVEPVAAFIIPSGSALAVFDAAAAPADWAVGDRIDVEYQTDDPAWADVHHALGAGFTTNMLVKDGQLGPGAVDETVVSSRTVFGVRADGSAFFAVIDKPVGSPTDGVTLKKLGQIALAYGAVKAVNLDGGGSSTMALRAPGEKYLHLVNTPSDGRERPVANKWGLVLKKDKVRYADGVDVLPKEVALLAGTELRFKALGYDGDSFSLLQGKPSFGMSSDKLGLISPATGQFRAADQETEGYVVAQLGPYKGAAKVRITKSPDALVFERPELALNAGQSVALLPTLFKEGRQLQYSPAQLQYSLSDESLGKLDRATGVFTAGEKLQGRQLDITVSYGALSATTKISIGVPPVLVEGFEAGLGAYTAGGARQKAVTLNLLSSGAFAGKQAVKLAWQADPAQPGTFGAYFIDPTRITVLQGYPKALGVQVYVPEALAGKVWWVRGQLRDADNKAVAINYNNDGDALPAHGWTFMKAAIPEGFRAPFRFDQPFRFLVLKTAERIDSHVYLDNFTAIYSDDTDLQGPEVQLSPADRETLTARNATLKLKLNDASGVDLNRVELLLDGSDISAQARHNGQDEFTVSLSNLADGWHRLSYRVFDLNGNVGAGETLFQVQTGASQVFIDDKHAQVYPAASFDFPLKALKAAPGDRIDLVLEFDATKSGLQVLNADATAENVVSRPGFWSGSFRNFGGESSTLALIRLRVADYVANGAVSVVVSGSINGKPFVYPVLRKEIGGRYRVLTSYAQQGQTTQLQIVDSSGKPAAGVSVESLEYNAATGLVSKQQLLGVTDAQGRVSYTAAPGTSSKEVFFRVFQAGSGASLLARVIAMPERLTALPRYLRLTPGATHEQMSLSWMTASTPRSHWLRYGETPALAQRVDVSDSELLPYFYGAESGVVRVHHAALSGLKPGTTYYYQVGNESGVSELMSFRTDDGDAELRIHLFGDTQTKTDGNLRDGAPLVSELLGKMQAQLPGADLMLHVGDMTEDGSDYQMQRQFFEALEGAGKLASVPLVPTLGNHEVYNEGRSKFESLFRTPANGPLQAENKQSIFSFNYGPARIAVINSELFSDAEWTRMMDWLVQDMQASKQPWKLLMIHRPPYAGNADSGNGFSKRFLPEAVDRAGIDLVISGHDHQYARSKPLTAGKPDGKGAIYLIAGSASAKFYNASSRDGMPQVAELLYDEDLQTYTTLHIVGGEMRLLTRNIYGKLVDQATLRPRQLR